MADETGNAVFYADYLNGQATASGEAYRHELMTAGHNKLPIGTIVRVTRTDNGRTANVRINDRGNYGAGTILNLSRAAAQQLDMANVGRARVTLTVVGFSNTNPTPKEMAQSAPAGTTTKGWASTPAPNTYSAPATMQARTPVATQPATAVAAQQQPVLQARGATPAAAVQKAAPTQQATAAKAADQVSVLANPISGFAVQLGSYGQFANAERHVVSLQKKGFNNVFVYQEKKADGNLINRVIVVPFTNVTEAQNYLADLRTYHLMDGVVVQMR
jgi:rare lipoprotein A